MTTCSSRAVVKWTVCGHNEADKEEVDDVEDADTPDDLPRCFGNFLPRILRLGGSQSRKFGSTKGERGCDKDSAEPVEAVEESAPWRMPKRKAPGQYVSGEFR